MKNSNFEFLIDRIVDAERRDAISANGEKFAANEVRALRAEKSQLQDRLMVTEHHTNKMKEALDSLYVALCDVVENVKSDAPEMWQRADDALAKAKVFRDNP